MNESIGTQAKQVVQSKQMNVRCKQTFLWPTSSADKRYFFFFFIFFFFFLRSFFFFFFFVLLHPILVPYLVPRLLPLLYLFLLRLLLNCNYTSLYEALSVRQLVRLSVNTLHFPPYKHSKSQHFLLDPINSNQNLLPCNLCFIEKCISKSWNLV